MLFRRFCAAIGLLFFASGLLARANAQAVEAATRSTAIDFYGGGSLTLPRFQTYESHEQGYLVGGDFTRHFRLLSPSLDVRYNGSVGTAAIETSFAGGLKIEKTYGRLRPYGDFLVGHGYLNYPTPLVLADGEIVAHDDSTLYIGGGGVDYNLSRLFALKADAQIQHWRLGHGTPPFEPVVLSVGLILHVPYKYLRPSRYY